MIRSRKYQDKNKIDRVVESLFDKGIDVFTNIENDKITLINDGNFKLKSIELFNAQKHLQTNFHGLFETEIEMLATIRHIDRALYLLLDSYCEVPMHTDHDDFRYRIVTGVIIPCKTRVSVLNNFIDLESMRSIGFQATDLLHSANNFSHEPCTMLVVCLNKNIFDTKELIEIKI